jgi:hypothetical protein
MLVPHQVRRDLVRLVESEELGESFFAAAANATIDESRRAQWEALHQLEAQTNRAARDFIEGCELDLKTTNAVAVGMGSVSGTVLHLMPQHVQLASLKLTSKRYLPAFRRLAHYYRATEHSPLFDYVVAHELAIVAFADKARHVNGCALDAVKRLLDAGTPK